MARLLVQLKLRLLLNALHSSRAAKVSFIISTIFAVLLAVGTFLALASYRGKSTSVDLTAVIFTVFAFGWLIAPIMVFGVDSTLDPSTLALYPLRTRKLITGLLAASATGAWPLANVIGLLGVTVGLASGALGLIVAVIAVGLQVLFCIALSRFVTTSLASLLRSRRGRDLAAFMIIPLFALYEFFTQVVPKAAAEGKITAASFTGFDCMDALAAARPGRARDPGCIGWASRPGVRPSGGAGRRHRRVRLAVDQVAEPGSGDGRHDDPGSVGIRGAKLPLAGLGLRGAVAARFWLYQRRDPTSLVYWALVAVITAAVSASSIIGHNRHPAVILASAVFGAAFVGIFHANSAGLTGPPFFLEATALSRSRDLRAYFSGQNLALCVIGAPLVIAVCFGLAATAAAGIGIEAAPIVLAGLARPWG